ncbi:MAG: hypothetical protein KC897_01180 [Candidatus Omnitrophica bacterium]|nr:hypothetical protein [Candidatus Omnitrophota bacterium]MCB9720095.1 hypothetical protein [Candidatus Omnitrophota bacterium]
MADLKSKKLIVLKGFLFMAIVAVSASLLYAQSPALKTAFLLTLVIWASARAYYFLFYVLYEYVDRRFKYAGLFSLIKAIRQGHSSSRKDQSPR